jgi:hypothetical protein
MIPLSEVVASESTKTGGVACFTPSTRLLLRERESSHYTLITRLGGLDGGSSGKREEYDGEAIKSRIFHYFISFHS